MHCETFAASRLCLSATQRNISRILTFNTRSMILFSPWKWPWRAMQSQTARPWQWKKGGKGETRIQDLMKWMLLPWKISTLSTIYSLLYCTQDAYVLHCIKWSMFPGGWAMRIQGGYPQVWSMLEIIRSRKERLYWSISLTFSKAFHPLWPRYLPRARRFALSTFSQERG